ncbi:MAG: DUF192 domain-containing protein [Candidatus Colwellbacteria bacterium]|nr:DUF192 domain-containing protein [Candidatus Colwellbacteria bacterium]
MDWFLLILSSAAIIIISLIIPFSEKRLLSVSGKLLDVVVVRSVFSKARGLSGSAPLPSNKGMLFKFVVPARPTFWNFGMKYAIDVVWIRNGVVTGMERNVQDAKSGLRFFSPGSRVDAVLELSAGSVERLGIVPYDRIEMISR